MFLLQKMVKDGGWRLLLPHSVYGHMFNGSSERDKRTIMKDITYINCSYFEFDSMMIY